MLPGCFPGMVKTHQEDWVPVVIAFFNVMLEILWTLCTCIPLFEECVFQMTTKFSYIQRGARTLSFFTPARLRRHGCVCGARQFITVRAKQTNVTQRELDDDDVRGNRLANSFFFARVVDLMVGADRDSGILVEAERF